MNCKVIFVAIACVASLLFTNAEEDNAELNPEKCKLVPAMVELRAKCGHQLMGKAILTNEEWMKVFEEKEAEAHECFHKESGEEPKEKLTEEDAEDIEKSFTFGTEELKKEALDAAKECIKEHEGEIQDVWICVMEKLEEICE